MKGYTFKITAESKPEVYREVLLPGDITFEDFHYAILDAFEIDPGEMASFYLSDKKWSKKKEIPLMDMAIETEDVVLMCDVALQDEVSDKQSHFYYVYDFLFCKNFLVELVDTVEGKEINPTLISSEGEYDVEDADLDAMLNDDYGTGKSKKGGRKEKDYSSELDNFEEFDNFSYNDDYGDDDEPHFENIDDFDDL